MENKNLKNVLHLMLGREPSEHEVFSVIINIDKDYPESNIWELYLEKQIKKVHEKDGRI